MRSIATDFSGRGRNLQNRFRLNLNRCFAATPHLAKSCAWFTALHQMPDFASSPSRGEEKELLRHPLELGRLGDGHPCGGAFFHGFRL
jgi:hypothetical protein